MADSQQPDQRPSPDSTPTPTSSPDATALGTSATNQSKPATTSTEHGKTTQAKPPGYLRTLNVANAALTTASSPLSSREPSPSRPARNTSMPTTTGMAPKRSRVHSQDTSPTRAPVVQTSSGTIPSAAAIQRALSSTTTPQLQPTQAQVSPRLKSPPPSASRSRKNSGNARQQQQQQQQQASQPSRKVEPASTPNIVVQSSTPPSSSGAARSTTKNEGGNSDSDEQGPVSMKGTVRGVSGAKSATPLETVQESSLPTSPGFELAEAQRRTPVAKNKPVLEIKPRASATKTSEDLSTKTSKSGESGSESGENRVNGINNSSQTRSVTTPRTTLSTRSSFTSLAPAKSRATNEAKSMTVETETVPSVPQATIGAPTDRSNQGRVDAGGSIRMKGSNETIRPKKEKKKPPRKAPSINSGTASSKADIFEAKVASAVDEADDSDSDETFVYESNPPEPESRPIRHHSRTPSTTSMASLADSRQTIRSIGNALDNQRQVPSKRSMKFASNAYNSISTDHDPNDRGEGTVRVSGTRSNQGSSIQHHHIGRHGRGAASIFDNDSPFPHSVRGKNSRQSSRPSSPRIANHSLRYGNGAGKQNSELSMYDMAGEAADDERTPLVGSGRGPRSIRMPRASRSMGTPLRHYEPYQQEQSGWLRRFAGCIVMTVMVVLLVAGAVGFLFATTKPLYDVQVEKIKNVLASDQELMLDLLVTAVNPNAISITVSDMDINLFAKSKHVVSDNWKGVHGPSADDSPWTSPREQRKHRTSLASRKAPFIGTGKDEGNDPIEDGDPQTMLLGRIFKFDSALVFEGSPIQRHLRHSVGELRLSKPGNKTEAGGSERWERVLEYPFELIVRGVLRYELPLSSHIHTAAIGSSIIVHPERGIDVNGTMWIETSKEHEAHGAGALFPDTSKADWSEHALA